MPSGSDYRADKGANRLISISTIGCVISSSSGLNNPQSERPQRPSFKGSVVESIFGEVPFLNGGLFEKTDLRQAQTTSSSFRTCASSEQVFTRSIRQASISP